MKVTPRAPKVTKARGNRSIPVGKPIDATSLEALEKGIAKRDAKLKSLEDELDLSWLVEGALAYLKYEMLPTSDDPPQLRRTSFDAKYHVGTCAIFSEPVRRNVTLRQGPARIVQHTWIMPGGGKFIISLSHLVKDTP